MEFISILIRSTRSSIWVICHVSKDDYYFEYCSMCIIFKYVHVIILIFLDWWRNDYLTNFDLNSS